MDEEWKNNFCEECGAALDKRGLCPACDPSEEEDDAGDDPVDDLLDDLPVLGG